MRARAWFGPTLVPVASLALALSAGNAWSAGVDTLPPLYLHVTSDLGVDRLLDADDMGCAGEAGGYAGFAGSCAGYNYYLEDSQGNALGDLASLHLTFALDPSIDLDLTVRNAASTPQTFTLTGTMVTGAFGGPNRMGGRVLGSLLEVNGGGTGASLSVPSGAAVYSALIDDVPVQSLLPGPFSVSVLDDFGGADVPNTAFGEPIPSAPGPDVLDSIGIRLRFTLSPGDRASVLGVFVVETPEPAIAGLLGLAGLGLALLRRRI
jgi:hypothetical protein